MLEGSPWGSLLWMLLSVGLVTGLAYWFTRNVVGRHRFYNRESRFQVLDSLTLGKSQKIAAVKAGSRYFLLGLTEHTITNLCELTEEEAAQWQQPAESGAPLPKFGQAFREQLQKKLKGEKK